MSSLLPCFRMSMLFLALFALMEIPPTSASPSPSPSPRQNHKVLKFDVFLNFPIKDLGNALNFVDSAAGAKSHEDEDHNHPLLKNHRLDSVGVPAKPKKRLRRTQKCLKRVFMSNSIEYDEVSRCEQMPQEDTCYLTYVTVYGQARVQECRDAFRKSCVIEYRKEAQQVRVRTCHRGFRRECQDEQQVHLLMKEVQHVCSNQYTTVCDTTHVSSVVSDDVPECEVGTETVCEDGDGADSCAEVPKRTCKIAKVDSDKAKPKTRCRIHKSEVCGPKSCPLKQGDPVCFTKRRTITQDVPHETCVLAPTKTCSTKTKILPSLKPINKCVKSPPREVCKKEYLNPRKVRRPVVKLWCRK